MVGIPSSRVNSIREPVSSEGLGGFNPLPDGINTPICIPHLIHCLRNYPNSLERGFVIQGLCEGFDIGFSGRMSDTRPCNAQSARDNRDGVVEAINTELQRGHTSGPFADPPFTITHVSPLGAVPKPDGSVRLILDLSSPRGSSVNDGIAPEDFACRYSKFDDAVDLVRHLGAGSFLGKLDIQHAFRLCPVRRDQWPLLCYRWEGSFFVDTRLPFGGRSSPFIFNTLANVLCWIFIVVGGVEFLIHYLDDYFLAHITHGFCFRDMHRVIDLCQHLGVPLAPGKIIGPVQRIVYLGIEIDTLAMSTSLPPDKLEKFHRMVNSLHQKKKVIKRELLSLIGLLSFVSKVVKPGRMFLRRLIDLSTTVTSLNFYVTLNSEARADLAWLRDFLHEWNGVAIIPQAPVSSAELELYTDASDLGFGCVYGTQWFYAAWERGWGETSINAREAFAIWAAVCVWGVDWRDAQVVIHTDSEVNTHVWKTGSCRDRDLMRVIRAMFMFAARHNISITLLHIPGKHNVLADCLSRFQVKKFRRAHPTAAPLPMVIPPEIWMV